MSAQYTNTVLVGQTTRTMTGSAIALSASALPVAKAIVCNRAGNANVTLGHNSTQLPITIAAGAQYVLEVAGFNGMRIDLASIFVSGTSTQIIDILYYT